MREHPGGSNSFLAKRRVCIIVCQRERRFRDRGGAKHDERTEGSNLESLPLGSSGKPNGCSRACMVLPEEHDTQGLWEVCFSAA
jgi:hypothetical protein